MIRLTLGLGLVALVAAGTSVIAVRSAASWRAKATALSAQVDALARENDANRRAAIVSYEAASAACRQNIRAAVAAVRLPKIEVPAHDQNGNPNPLCPAVRLRDIQAAGATDSLPASPDSDDPARADSPR